MTEYWLISAPGEKTCQQTWETLNNVTSKQHNLSVNFKFQIPDLKVGTLDQLVGLSDDLGKLDVYAEGITRKIASYLGDVIEDHNDRLAELLLANGVEMAQYLTKFQWESAKYPVKQSLRNLAEIISKKINQIESELKVKSQAYNTLKSSIESIERKQTGSLVSRDLADLVKKEDFVLNSEYLTTLVVVVPKSGVSDWNSHYENLTDMVVPRSSKLITEDADYCLYTVTLFDKVKSEFSLKARERRFIVRDFTYDEEKLAEGKNERDKLLVDKKKKYGSLVRWLKVNFSEAFSAWIHVKALRLFVESVLRYGLPVNFQAMILHPPKRSMKRLAEVLNQLYSHLDSSSLPQNQSDANSVEIPGLSFGQSEYYPYVCYKIDIDMIPHRTRVN